MLSRMLSRAAPIFLGRDQDTPALAQFAAVRLLNTENQQEDHDVKQRMLRLIKQHAGIDAMESTTAFEDLKLKFNVSYA